MKAAAGRQSMERLLKNWRDLWPRALEAWSRFTKLTPPRWCLAAWEEKGENLTQSFAMIRLTDHAVVISLRQVRELGLEGFPVEIMAHEVGHHVFAPGDLRDNARLLARVRAGLPSAEEMSGLVANLYTDLLINDRLRRGAGLDMAGLYQALGPRGGGKVWTLYLRIYEVLWGLPAGSLTARRADKSLDADAFLGSRVVKVYGRDWLKGAGRFAALLLPYILEERTRGPSYIAGPWLDAERAGEGGGIPDGLAEMEDDEEDGALHPSEDGALTGIEDGEEGKKPEDSAPRAGARATGGGRKNTQRSPEQYRSLMKSIGVDAGEKELVIRYYRELAVPHLVPFPVRERARATDPLPEGLDVWEPGDSFAGIDWLETVVRGPEVIPGVTTVQRVFGTSEGDSPERTPLDLYVGIDCSGSMSNPALSLSYPVLAGAIVALSALRAGARVMACLSGEPGEYSQTKGFVRSERKILGTLTGYHGTGYAFGVARLEKTFVQGEAPARPAHILVVSDSDIFEMLKRTEGGWEIAAKALERAGGGGTMVLQIAGGWEAPRERLRSQGWRVHVVTSREELVRFARAFSRARYESPSGRRG